MLKRSLIGALASAVCLAWISSVQAASDIEFQRLLSAPDDPQLNRQYAASAEARGDLRHALAALDRALSVNPNDPDLIAAYDRVRRKLLPTTTLVTFQVGSTYASNPRQLSNGSPDKEDDVIFDGAISVEDEHTVAGMRIRSLAYAAGQWNVETSELSTGKVFAQSGPVVMLSKEAWAHIAPGVGTEWLDANQLYTEATGALTLGTVYEGLTQTVMTRYGVRFGADNSLAYQDSQIFEILGRFVFGSSFTAGDYIYLQPGFRLSDAFDDSVGTQQVTASIPGDTTVIGPFALVTQDLSPYSYHEWGGRISYFVPFDKAGSFYLGAGISVYQREFDTYVADPEWLARGVQINTDEKRRDIYIEPTAHLIFPNLVAPNVDLRADYRFELNESNDDSRDFQNHVGGIRLVGRF